MMLFLILWTTLMTISSSGAFVPAHTSILRTIGLRQTRQARSRSRSLVRGSMSVKPMEIWIYERDTTPEHPIFSARERDWREKADVILVNNVAHSDSSSDTIYRVHDGKLLDVVGAGVGGTHGAGRTVGAVVNLSSGTAQDRAVSLIGSVEWILLEFDEQSRGAKANPDDDNNVDTAKGWKMIPAENLIASCSGTGTKLAVMVSNAADVTGLSRALELGVDALCVSSDATDELWSAVVSARDERERTFADKTTSGDGASGTTATARATAGPMIQNGTCRRKSNAAVLADRICLDFIRTLSPTEGCWIGSSSQLLALILSENSPSSYVPTRPFRINAGPVHSYVLLGDGVTTKYLCEVQAGDEILVYDCATGLERAVAVGRLKEEVRPCVIVELTTTTHRATATQEDIHHGGHTEKVGQVFLQQAETVRLGSNSNTNTDRFVRVTDLKPSTDANVRDTSKDDSRTVLLRVSRVGTHVGQAYTGSVNET